MHIKTYAVDLNKRQRAMKKLKVVCDNGLKVITYVDNMHKNGIFKERELLFWENTPALQGWTETQYCFDTIWTNRTSFNIRLEGPRPYESAIAMSTTQTSKQDHKEAMYLLHSLERENTTLKDKLDATTIATTSTPPSTTPPPKIIATATTTVRDDALIAALKEQSATHTAQITKLLAALSSGGWKRRPWQQRTRPSRRQHNEKVEDR